MLDVGPGSTELIVEQQRQISWLISLPLGSSWLRNHYLLSNPPTRDEVEQARSFLQNYVQGLDVPERPSALIGTGSGPKALLKLAKQALKLDQHSDRLTQTDLRGCLGLLTSLPTEELARRYEQSLERAWGLAGGTLIILEMMHYLHLDQICLSAYGLPQGVLLAYARYGKSWLDHPEVKVDPAKEGKAPPLSSARPECRQHV